MIGPESLIALGPQPGLHAQAVDGPVPGANALYEAFSGPAAEEPTGLWASSIAEVADLDLWLTLTEPGLTRLNLMGRHETQASPAQQRIANLMPLGGLAKVGDSNGLGVAAFNFKEDEIQPGSFKITPGLAKVEPAEEHRKARTMIDTLIRRLPRTARPMARLRLRSVGAPVPARPACDVGPGGGCGHSCTLRLCSAARPRTWLASKMTGSVWLAGGQGDPWLPRGRAHPACPGRAGLLVLRCADRSRAPRAGSWRRRHCCRQADCGRGRPAPWLPPQVRPARSPWPAPRGESRWPSRVPTSG